MTSSEPAKGVELTAKLAALIDRFAHSPMNVRLQITRELLSHGRAALPALIDGLSHESWAVRQDCANALAEVPDKTALPALIESLNDREPGVVYEAARALGKLGGKEAKKALQDATVHTDDDGLKEHLLACIDGTV